jgi:hypothetical protein
MTDYERGLYQAKIADLEKQLEGGVPVQHEQSETRGGGPAGGEDIVVRMKEWIRLPIYGTARDIMARGAKEIETLRALLANRWMADGHGGSQPRQNHRRPDQR